MCPLLLNKRRNSGVKFWKNVLRIKMYIPIMVKKGRTWYIFDRYDSNWLQPFNVVSDSGFKIFVNKLYKRYKLPAASTVKSNLLSRRYEEIKSVLLDKLKCANYVSLTTESWTLSFSSDAYITVTCHFIENFWLRSFVLEIEKLARKSYCRISVSISSGIWVF